MRTCWPGLVAAKNPVVGWAGKNPACWRAGNYSIGLVVAMNLVKHCRSAGVAVKHQVVWVAAQNQAGWVAAKNPIVGWVADMSPAAGWVAAKNPVVGWVADMNPAAGWVAETEPARDC